MNDLMNFIENLSNSDFIQLLGILAALITSMISIIISVATLHQNSKMIKDSTRPYITITFDFFNFGSPIAYFIIKNYGQTQAVIDSIKCNTDLMNFEQDYGKISNFTGKTQGMTLAPNQKIMIPFRIEQYTKEKAIFDIHYSNDKQKYKEHFDIGISNYKKFFKSRVISYNTDKNIAYTLEEIAERLL